MDRENASKEGEDVMAVNSSAEIEWIQPKTDWSPSAEERFNIEDYNRIKNNLNYLHEKAMELYGEFSIQDMGSDIEIYTAFWNPDDFNTFEKNLDTINKNTFTRNIGSAQTFYPNGIFIKWDELNRIESAMVRIRNTLIAQKESKNRLSFRLGAFRKIKV